jgi:hypothetical protein
MPPPSTGDRDADIRTYVENYINALDWFRVTRSCKCFGAAEFTESARE